MAFIEDEDGGGEISEEIKAENEKYGELMCYQKDKPVQGIFRGTKEVPGYQGKGKQKQHAFEQEDGSILKIRGFGLMDWFLRGKDVEDKNGTLGKYGEGDLLRITYAGKVDGNHKCTVAKDDGQGDGEDL